jgi:hypothetical protein
MSTIPTSCASDCTALREPRAALFRSLSADDRFNR